MRVIDGTSGLSAPTTLMSAHNCDVCRTTGTEERRPDCCPHSQLGAALEASDFDFIPAVRIAKTEEVREPSAS